MAQVRVRVRSGEYEFEVECSKEEFGSVLSLADQLIEAVAKIRGSVRAPLEGEQGKAQVELVGTGPTGSEDIPQITGQMSLRRAIVELLDSPWGREPRTVAEIMEALRLNAAVYPRSTVGPSLIRMARTGELRRLKKGDLYSYVLAKRPGAGSE